MIFLTKGSLVRKLPSYGLLSCLAFPPSPSLFPLVRGWIWESCRQKVHRTVAGVWFALQNLKTAQRSEHFWKMRSPPRQNVHQTVVRARFHIKNRKKLKCADCAGFARSSPHCHRCANVGRFGVALLPCGFATGCDKTHWHGCAQHSMSDGKRDCSWRLLNASLIASRKAVLDHSGTVVLFGIAAGACCTQCNNCAKRRTGKLQKPR